MWVLAGERSIYLTRAPFTSGRMGHAIWPCPLKVAGVGMGSPRLVRIIGFLGCVQVLLGCVQLYQKKAEMNNLNICKKKLIRLKNLKLFEN